MGKAPFANHDAFGEAEWRLDSDSMAVLYNKVFSNGKDLLEYTKGKLFRGVITGLTDAFIIDTNVWEQFATNRDSEAIILRYAEGKDLRPWCVERSGRYVIAFPKGWTNARIGHMSPSDAERRLKQMYPIVYEWLLPYRDRAIQRLDQGDFW